jgi:hypothetical protein
MFNTHPARSAALALVIATIACGCATGTAFYKDRPAPNLPPDQIATLKVPLRVSWRSGALGLVRNIGSFMPAAVDGERISLPGQNQSSALIQLAPGQHTISFTVSLPSLSTMRLNQVFVAEAGKSYDAVVHINGDELPAASVEIVPR